MVHISFPDPITESKALGFLAGRFSFKSFENGTTLVPEVALGHLAARGLRFTVQGAAIYEQVVPTIRSSTSSEV